jgi:hypothetical protein
MAMPGESMSSTCSRIPRGGGYQLLCDEVFHELGLIRTIQAMNIQLHDATQMLESRRSDLCTRTSQQAAIRNKAGVIEQRGRLL